jgi:hypothetical protein
LIFFYNVFITVECLNLGLKGVSMGPLYVLRGVGGHGLSAYRIPLGPTRGAQQRAVPEPRSGEGCTPPAQRAVTFMQHCIHNATVHRSRPTAREAGPKNHQPRSGAQPMREHAHNLCVYNAGAPATICRIDISRSVDLDSWIVKKYIFD